MPVDVAVAGTPQIRCDAGGGNLRRDGFENVIRPSFAENLRQLTLQLIFGSMHGKFSGRFARRDQATSENYYKELRAWKLVALVLHWAWPPFCCYC